MSTVRKAVIPAAGMGTRFLPATKALPKGMVPVVDKPAIQYVVEEAARAGLDDVLIITSIGNPAIEDHFDRAFELEHFLEARGKHETLKAIRAISELAHVHFVRQRDPKGLGHAVSLARHHVGDEPFAVLLADDVMHEQSRLLEDMIAAHQRVGGSILALKEFPPPEISLYGCVRASPADDGLVRVHEIVEKPAAHEAPSNQAVIGRYVLAPEIFDALDRVAPGKGGEIQLTDAIGLLLETQPVYGHIFDTGRYDVGNRLGFLQATVELALEREDVGAGFRAFLADLVRREGIVPPPP